MMSDEAANHNLDHQELELPETLYVRDIEDRVFQSIVFECLSRIEGVGLVEGGFLKNIWGRETAEGFKGVQIKQDSRNQSVSVRIEVNIAYGVPIPSKAEEVQAMISKMITSLTGLHVSRVHVVFRGLIPTGETLEKENQVENNPCVVEIKT